MLGLLFYSHPIPKKRQKRTTFLRAVSRSVALPHLYAFPPPLSQDSKTIKPDSPVPFIVDGNSLISAIGQDNWEWKNTVTSESFNNEIMMNYSQTFHLV